ncbi:MAG: M3 family metallopeptidase [Chlamydiota bacterium]
MKRFFNLALKGIILIGLCSLVILEGKGLVFAKAPTLEDIKNIFPETPELMIQQAESSMAEAKQLVRDILVIPDRERTFANTAKKLDELSALSNLSLTFRVIHVLEMVSPEEAIRNTAQQTLIRMQEFSIDEISNNFDLYKAFKAYYEGNAPHENLSPKERYYLDETMAGFRRDGFDLPEEQRQQIKQINKDLAQLTLQFETNIAADQTRVIVNKDALPGLSEGFVASLEATPIEYHLTIDFPTYWTVMTGCLSADTRKLMYKAYANRAYPINDEVLKEIILKRDQLAHLVGFDSYAAYDIDQQMAKTPARAQFFLDDLIERIKPKIDEEFHDLTNELPPSVQLSFDGKLYPWDRLFVEDQYKKEHLQVDEQAIAEYFPVEKTIKGLLSIYEAFFSLQFKEKKVKGFWHDEVISLEVYSQNNNQLLGYLLLDLFPRPFKFGHACDINIIPATYQKNDPNVALSLVVTNFPRAQGDKPALLERSQVETFFHEFGHALHDLLGRTELASLSGTSVKTDFVEMPSQMLEEWVSNKEILTMISSHYETGKPMPEALIDSILGLKNFCSGLWMQRQLQFACLSLDLFGPGELKDPYQTAKKINESMDSHFIVDPESHMYAAFGHLSGYGAKYYGYMWSKVFALDLFAFIKERGLLDPKIGERYSKEVIGQGGSVDPNILLENFLGREPNNTAFLKDIGIAVN